jgi:hypothetical protein
VIIVSLTMEVDTYPNGISKTVLVLCFLIYFFTGGYSLTLAIAGATFYFKNLAAGTQTDLCGYYTNATVAARLANTTQLCDVIYPIMWASSGVLGLMVLLAILFIVVKRCLQNDAWDPYAKNPHSEDLSVSEQLKMHFHDMRWTGKNFADALFIVFLLLFWLILIIPVFIRCANRYPIISCPGEIVLRVACGIIANLGSIGAIGLWVLLAFYPDALPDDNDNGEVYEKL